MAPAGNRSGEKKSTEIYHTRSPLETGNHLANCCAFTQAESEDKSTNIKWGIKRSTSHPGSPFFSRTCFGYDRDEQKNLVINEHEADTVKKIFGWYIQGWSIVRIKKELETLRIPSPRGKRRWAVRTISDMLSNEKYAGNSAYSKTVIAEYPSMRQVKNSPDKVLKSENHHTAIIDKVLFNRIQEMRRIRTNVEVNEQGNKVRDRKSTRLNSSH